jgi:hypothetical protein
MHIIGTWQEIPSNSSKTSQQVHRPGQTSPRYRGWEPFPDGWDIVAYGHLMQSIWCCRIQPNSAIMLMRSVYNDEQKGSQCEPRGKIPLK